MTESENRDALADLGDDGGDVVGETTPGEVKVFRKGAVAVSAEVGSPGVESVEMADEGLEEPAVESGAVSQQEHGSVTAQVVGDDGDR